MHSHLLDSLSLAVRCLCQTDGVCLVVIEMLLLTLELSGGQVVVCGGRVDLLKLPLIPD